MSRLYEIELWDLSGKLVADISHLATNRRYGLQRNAEESLTFSLDLNTWEDFCDNALNSNPVNILNPLQTNIRVKRDGDYLFGVYVVDQSLDAGADSQTISVTCTGYLNLLKNRYVTKTYAATEATTIAWGIIDEIQTGTNASLGITQGANQYATGVTRDRTYTRDNAKQMLQNLTSLVDGTFDFRFTYDKQFETYEALGALRDDLQLIYGTGGNIKALYYPKSGTSTYNKVYGLGSGFGADQLISIQEDTDSEKAFYVRENIVQFNSVTEQDTLDQNTQGAVLNSKDLLKIPQVTITGNELAGLDFLSIGDRVPVKAVGHSYLNDVNQHYRIEKMNVTIDDNDFETDIVLYFDSQGVDQDELAA